MYKSIIWSKNSLEIYNRLFFKELIFYCPELLLSCFGHHFKTGAV